MHIGRDRLTATKSTYVLIPVVRVPWYLGFFFYNTQQSSQWLLSYLKKFFYKIIINIILANQASNITAGLTNAVLSEFWGTTMEVVRVHKH